MTEPTSPAGPSAADVLQLIRTVLNHGGGYTRVAEAIQPLLDAATARAEQAEAALDDEHATAVTRAHETDRARRELRAAERRITAACDALNSVHDTMARDPRDWALDRRDAWLYALLVGWKDVLPDIADQHGWTTDARTRAANFRAAIAGIYTLDEPALDGPADTPAPEQQIITLPPKPTPPGPMLAQPCTTGRDVSSFEGLGALADTITAMARSEAAQREAKIGAALAENGFTVVRTDPVEEVAAEPRTVSRLLAEFRATPDVGDPATWSAADLQGRFLYSLSLVTDESLPAGEVHLRPRTRAATQ